MTVIILLISLLNFLLIGLNFLQYMKILEATEEILEYIHVFFEGTEQQSLELSGKSETTTGLNEEDLLIRLEQFQRMKFSNTKLSQPKREK